jgi:D-sedoheptulose 7-phosphate isomerase
MARPAVFLDRDGVVNAMVYDIEFGTVDSPANPGQVTVLPGVPEAIAELNRAGLPVVIISNQPGIAKGKLSPSLSDAIGQRVLDEVEAGGGRIDAVYACPHHPDGVVDELAITCDCRKPAPGLLERAAADLDLDLAASWMVGYGVTDVVAGSAVGARTLFVNSPKAYIAERLDAEAVWPAHFVTDLADAVRVIIASRQREEAGGVMGDRGKVDEGADTFVAQHLEEAVAVIRQLDQREIGRMVDGLAAVRERGGRLFILGVGGGAGHASHAVNDFRKIVGLESYAPTDNVSELSARINDDGWETVFAHWLAGSRLAPSDAVLVFSVGGGDLERNISPNIVRALEYSRSVGATIMGIVGRDGGYTAEVADCCVVIPVVNPESITPHTEAFQAVVWHLLVSHPKLLASTMKWESAL